MANLLDISSATGAGVIVAIIDSGMDLEIPAFRKSDGRTRVIAFWDQGHEGSFYGKIYSEEEINQMLFKRENLYWTDLSGHGTAVASIAGGNRNSFPTFQGMAPECEFVVVKLASSRNRDFPKTTQIMRAVSFCLEVARRKEMPLVINLSFGNCYGNHKGTSLLERFLNNASEVWKSAIVVGSGNEADSFGHVEVSLRNFEREIVELSISDYEASLSIQLWCMWQEEFEYFLRSPSGEYVEIPINETGYHSRRLGTTILDIWVGVPSPYELEREIYISFVSENRYINSGIWTLEFYPKKITTGKLHLYLPSYKARATGTRFMISSPDLTLTIPSTAERLISVGAYNEKTLSYASFSGRGDEKTIKPDVSAPGVMVDALAPGNQLTKVTGTSFSTPYVSGMSALLMEKGIVRGEDPYMYGSKLKAELIRRAKPLSAAEKVPDSLCGYGIL